MMTTRFFPNVVFGRDVSAFLDILGIQGYHVPVGRSDSRAVDFFYFQELVRIRFVFPFCGFY